MNRFIIRDGTTTFTRISKREAFRLFSQGKLVALCPVKLRPGYPFSPHVFVSWDPTQEWRSVGESWERLIREFTWYNCSCEAGYYPAFYVESDTRSPQEIADTQGETLPF